MKKRSNRLAYLAGVASAVLTMALPACQGVNTVNDPEFVEGADRFVNQTVGPEYEAYVMQDPELGTPGEVTPLRSDRLNNVRSFRDLVSTAKTELEQTPPD